MQVVLLGMKINLNLIWSSSNNKKGTANGMMTDVDGKYTFEIIIFYFHLFCSYLILVI